MTSTIRRIVLAGVAVLSLGAGGAALTGVALAQPAPGAPAADPAAPPPPPPPGEMHAMGGPMGGPMGGHGPMMHGDMMRHGPMGWMHRPHPFGLLFTAPDRKLTAADVQTIVQGFLLWHGNHTWKVGNVQAQGDVVAFTLTTPDGSAIASFTMDVHDGRVQRTG